MKKYYPENLPIRYKTKIIRKITITAELQPIPPPPLLLFELLFLPPPELLPENVILKA